MASARVKKAPVDDPAGQSDRLVEAVRALIREELGKPATPQPPPPKPSWREAFWLLVFCGNVFLVLSRLPQKWFAVPGVELAIKLLPALLGSLFVIYLAWFRERLMAISRRKRFHGLQLGLFAVLVLLALQIFPVNPIISPSGAGLIIDGKRHQAGHEIRLAFGGHDVTLLRPAGEDKLDPARRSNERTFRFGLLPLLTSVSRGEQPDWGLLTKVHFAYNPSFKDDPRSKLRIRKLRGEFYEDLFDRTGLVKVDKTRIEVGIEEDISKLIMLPIGWYEVTPVWGSGKECKAAPLEAKYGITVEVVLEGCQ